MIQSPFCSLLESDQADAAGPADASQPGDSSFLTGLENRLLASVVATLVAQRNGDESIAAVHDLVVLHGPSGTGKSHLARDLVAWWQKQNPTAPVVTLAGAEFAQAYAAAVQSSQRDVWRSEIRSAALFVLDGLEDLTTRPGAQQELRHTLDALADNGALAVVTAQAPPGRIAGVSAGLRSRLAGALVVELAPAAVETRLAVLERAAAVRGSAPAAGALRVLAEHSAASLAEVVATLGEIDTLARSRGRQVDAQTVREFLIGQKREERFTLRSIALATARHFRLKLADLKSPVRRREVVAARGVAMSLSRKLTKKSLQQIGVYFGGRDHTTVLNGCRRVEQLAKSDPGLRQALSQIREKLARI